MLIVLSNPHPRGDRVDIHKNARLTVFRPAQLAEQVILQGSTLNSAAVEFKVCARTAAKWAHRYRQHGPRGLADRSSRPLRSPRRTAPDLVQRVALLRRQRCTGWHIAQSTGLSRATVSRLYTRVRVRKGHSIAVGAVARHLAEAAFHVLQRQEVYRDPTTVRGSDQGGVSANLS
jgi:hypothetical protein